MVSLFFFWGMGCIGGQWFLRSREFKSKGSESRSLLASRCYWALHAVPSASGGVRLSGKLSLLPLARSILLTGYYSLQMIILCFL